MDHSRPPVGVIVSGLILLVFVVYVFLTALMGIYLMRFAAAFGTGGGSPPGWGSAVLVVLVGVAGLVWNIALFRGRNWARQLFVIGMPLLIGAGLAWSESMDFWLLIAGIYLCLVAALTGAAANSYFGGSVWVLRQGGGGERAD